MEKEREKQKIILLQVKDEGKKEVLRRIYRRKHIDRPGLCAACYVFYPPVSLLTSFTWIDR